MSPKALLMFLVGQPLALRNRQLPGHRGCSALRKGTAEVKT